MTLLWILLSGVVTGALGYAVGKQSREPLNLDKARQSIHFRVAVHEAGHAVVGWRAPTIRILTIEMDEGLGLGRGRVTSAATRRMADFARDRWWDAAFCFGGIAGELLETKKARSGNCLDDLNQARAAARDIVAAGLPDPPWTPVATDTGVFDPHKSFQDLSESEARVLRLAYAHARALLQQEREVFSRVTHALLERGSLDEAAVREILS